MLLRILLGLVVGVVASASVSDYIWKRRLNPPARVVCRHCAHGNSSVEVLGLWIHQYQDRWISCSAHPETEVVHAKYGITASSAGAPAWQSDEELIPAMQQRG
jgi:hypothetical protein